MRVKCKITSNQERRKESKKERKKKEERENARQQERKQESKRWLLANLTRTIDGGRTRHGKTHFRGWSDGDPHLVHLDVPGGSQHHCSINHTHTVACTHTHTHTHTHAHTCTHYHLTHKWFTNLQQKLVSPCLPPCSISLAKLSHSDAPAFSNASLERQTNERNKQTNKQTNKHVW